MTSDLDSKRGPRPTGRPEGAGPLGGRRPQAASGGSRPAFIFDIDGTIIDSMPVHGKSWELFLARHGRAYAGDAFLRASAGRTGVEIMREIFGPQGADGPPRGARPSGGGEHSEHRGEPLSDEAAWALVHEKETLYRELFLLEFREIPGFRAFARAARAQGIAIACATAGDAGNIAFALGNLGMADEFDARAGAHDVTRGKPAPDLFLLAAERAGADPARSIVFEDAPLGIEGARRAGMHAVAITSGEPASKLAGPHVLAALPDYRDVTPADILALAAARAPA